MEKAIEFYKKAKGSYQTSYYRVNLLRELLEHEINNDRVRLLTYKAENIPLANYEQGSFFIAAITLIATLLSLIIDRTELETVFLVIVYLTIAAVVIFGTLHFTGRYRVILVVLEDIERDMQADDSKMILKQSKKLELILYDNK